MRIVFKSEDLLLANYFAKLSEDLAAVIKERDFWRDKVLVGHGVIVDPSLTAAKKELELPVQVGNHLASWPEMKRRLEKAARKKDEAPSPAEVDNNRKPDGISNREFKMMAEKAARELREN